MTPNIRATPRPFVRRATLIPLLLWLCLAAAASPVPTTLAETAAFHTARYLAALKSSEFYLAETERTVAELSKSDPARAAIEARNFSGNLQSLAEHRANVGDMAEAISAFDRHMHIWEEQHGGEQTGDESGDLALIDKSQSADAVEVIARAAQAKRIVILNEAHHVAADRFLAMNLARALRKMGFEYMACETFSESTERPLEDGYAIQKTGVYSREATYAKFLMDAHKSGWKFVRYEPSQGPREFSMAKNIVKRILDKDANAKIFIYVGYAHAMKVPVSERDDDQSEFAAQLRRLTGIDPLTIDQTKLFAHYGGAQQAVYYQHALRRALPDRPSVLVDKNGSPIKLSMDHGAYDIEVVHPRYANDPRTLRPTWLGVDFKAHEIPRELIPKSNRRVIYAYLKGSRADAVPLDAVLVEPKKPVPKLMLPNGEFVFEYED